MRQITIFMVLYFPFAMAADIEEPNWYPDRKYESSKNFAKALEVAQAYYLENEAKPAHPIDYEFNAYSVAGGYIVSIDVLYRQKGGEHSVAIDSEYCIYLNENYKIKGARQCMSAGPGPLAP